MRVLLTSTGLETEDTKPDVHCGTETRGGRVGHPLKDHIRLTNTSALIVREFPDESEIIGE